MSDDNITKLDDRRKKAQVASPEGTLIASPELPNGPFTVSVSDQDGKMFEVVFPDFKGELPPDANILATCFEGSGKLLCNLLTGAMRVYLGTK